MLGPKYIGPFRTVKIINPVTVELWLPKIIGKVHLVFHCSLLKPAQGSKIRPVGKETPGAIIVGGEEYYEIKRILDSTYYKWKLQYLVQWKGYPRIEAEWIKANNVKEDWLMNRFHLKYLQKPGGDVKRNGMLEYS